MGKQRDHDRVSPGVSRVSHGTVRGKADCLEAASDCAAASVHRVCHNPVFALHKVSAVVSYPVWNHPGCSAVFG